MLHAEKTVVFASDYPHWDFDNPLMAFTFFPRRRLKRRIFVENALELYGPRLLAVRDREALMSRRQQPCTCDDSDPPRSAVSARGRSTSTCTTRSPTGRRSRPTCRRGCATGSRAGRPAAGPPRLQADRAALGVRRAAGRRRQAGHPAADPAWVKEQYLDPRGVDLAILTGTLLSLGVQPNADMAAAIARGVNDWTLETWVRPFDCFKGSILVAQQDPVQAVAEIDRLGDDPGMVQVLMGSASETPLGRRQLPPDLRGLRPPRPAAGPAHRRRGGGDVAAGDGGRPPVDLLRVVRLAAAESTWPTS